MIINEIHSFVKFLKNQGQNIYHTPEEIDDAINRASLDLFRQEIKVFEREQILTDTLRPFKAREVYSSAGSLYILSKGQRQMLLHFVMTVLMEILLQHLQMRRK
jgi:hypothetical protein